MARTRPQDPSDDAGSVHVPVLAEKVLRHLGGEAGAALEGWIVDGTVGAGGHAERLLESFPGVRVLGIDQDPQILELARARLGRFGGRARLAHARLSELSRLLRKERLERPVGLLLDLGASSLQLDRPERGFSFQADGPLDMRMDPRRERTAADVVNRWDESDLADLLFWEGGERRARQVASAIVASRRRAPFLRTGALAELVAQVVGGGSGRPGAVHPATRTFQALRRAVNEEGEELQHGLEAAQNWLAPGGRLAAISFHSGEDAEVKRFLAEGAREGRWRVLTKKPETAERAEVQVNRRARSAKLRVAERTDVGVAENGVAGGEGHGA